MFYSELKNDVMDTGSTQVLPLYTRLKLAQALQSGYTRIPIVDIATEADFQDSDNDFDSVSESSSSLASSASGPSSAHGGGGAGMCYHGAKRRHGHGAYTISGGNVVQMQKSSTQALEAVLEMTKQVHIAR